MIVLPDSVISTATGSTFGNMTGGGGANAAFDGTLVHAIGTAANRSDTNSGYVGRTLGSRSGTVVRALVYGSTSGFVFGGDTSFRYITLSLYGKTGPAPADQTQGILLGSLSLLSTGDDSASHEIRANVLGKWDHLWLRISIDDGSLATLAIGEVLFYQRDDFIIGSRPILFWDSAVTVSTISALSENPDFPASNLANPSTALIWKEDTTDSPMAVPTYISVNTTGFGPINFVAIAGHNFSTIAALIAIESDGTDSPTLSELVTGTSIDDDGPLIFVFGAVEATTVHIRIEHAGTTPAQAAVVYVGAYTEMNEGIQQTYTPLPMARVTTVISGKSEDGTFLGRIQTAEGFSSTATFANMERDFVREELLPFIEFAVESPFFYAWNPATYPAETAFAWLENDPQPSLDHDGYFAIDLAMRGLA